MESAAETVIAPQIMVPLKWTAKFFCDNPEMVKKIYTIAIDGIKWIIKKRKEDDDTEKITEPELQKTANVVFTGLLKNSKKFCASLQKTFSGKNTDNPTDTGTIFRKPITSL